MSKRFLLCILALLVPFTFRLRAGNDKRQLDVFVVPWPLHIISGTTSDTAYFPIVPNPIQDCLQGNIYDVKGAFDPKIGINFEKNDIVWFSPKSQLLVVRASAANVESVRNVLNAVNYDPAGNLTLDAKVSISQPANAKTGPQESMSFKITAHSGQRCIASSTGPDQPGYNWEFEPVVGPDGKTVDCNMVLKVTYKGHEYAVTTSFSVLCGKTHTLLIGNTPDKREITFSLTAAYDWLEPETSLDNPKSKAPLLKRIKKELAL